MQYTKSLDYPDRGISAHFVQLGPWDRASVWEGSPELEVPVHAKLRRPPCRAAREGDAKLVQEFAFNICQTLQALQMLHCAQLLRHGKYLAMPLNSWNFASLFSTHLDVPSAFK
jgi:hypothetical protein